MKEHIQALSIDKGRIKNILGNIRYHVAFYGCVAMRANRKSYDPSPADIALVTAMTSTNNELTYHTVFTLILATTAIVLQWVIV